jgi:AraC-like DNA-binding protein
LGYTRWAVKVEVVFFHAQMHVERTMPPSQQTNARTPPVNRPGCWILHARAKEYHWEGSGLLSIKTFFGGRAHYRVGSAHHAVDDSSYLVLNQGQTYAIDIQSREPVESFCLFFARGLVEDAQRAITSRVEQLLDEPANEGVSPVCFFEKNYAHDTIVSPAISWLRLNYRNREDAWLLEHFHDVIERLLRVHRNTVHETERLKCVRRGTRDELYRRVCRARDYIWAMFPEPVTLPEIARVACLSPNHLLRTFRNVFGKSPHQLLTERRLDEAKRLLATTDLSVTDICLASGFESLGSFSFLFRKRCSYSPSEYRRAKR